MRPQVLVRPLAGQLCGGCRRDRARREERELDRAAARLEVRWQLQARDRCRLGMKSACAFEEREREVVGGRAGQPDCGVPRGEPFARPRGHLVHVDPAEPELHAVQQAEAGDAEAAAEQEPKWMRRPALRLREEHAPFGVEPLERQRADAGRHVREEAAHLLACAGRPEDGPRLVDEAVDVELPSPAPVEREMLDEVREAQRGQRLVGQSDPEDERAREWLRSVRPEDGHSVDGRALDYGPYDAHALPVGRIAPAHEAAQSRRAPTRGS